MATSMSACGQVENASGEQGDVEVVGEVGNCLQNIILDFNQPFMNCHLQVTMENYDELF